MSGYQVSQDFLLNDAYQKVWCTPEQDKQIRLQLPRVSPPNGVWTYFNYLWRKIQLPVTGAGVRFHVYQVGQVHPSILGMLSKPNTWISAKELMENESVLMEVYNAKGVIIPRSLCWYIVLGDKNLLVAVRKPSEAPVKLVDVDLETDDIFMRLYSNAYFNSLRADYPEGSIRVDSVKADFISDINAMQAKIQNLPSFGGRYYYVNGRRVDQLDLITAKPGDYIEYVFDASIKREIVFKVSALEEFESVLDNLHKFLLHYPGKSDSIDYQDDIDLYLGTVNPNGNRWSGVAVHKNDSRTLRMVTHRDYSVPVIRINGTQAANPFLIGKDLDLRMTIRYSGYDRPLIFENNRIAELYKLPVDLVEKAMVGIDSTVSVWEAGALEASAYTQIMRQEQGGVTKQMVQSAYGYNAMSVLLGYTPSIAQAFGANKVIEIPEGLRGCCTIYEYNADGKLLCYASHTTDNTFVCQDNTTAFAEVIYGIGDTALDAVDSTVTGVLNPLHNYRFYMGKLVAGVTTWTDVTGDPYYSVVDNTYRWNTSAAPINRVLSNKRHLAYTFEMAPLAGVFEFDLAMFKGGVFQKLDIPLGELDFFFNGYSLIEGLDFVVHGSRVIITTKKYFDPMLEKQSITVRYTGFCNKDMGRTAISDVGFVLHGNLSGNKYFDVRDDKVIRIVCGGVTRLRKDVNFAEDGVGVTITNSPNGAPYAIRDIVVPMNNYLVSDGEINDKTYEYRAAAMAIDKEISDYLTVFLPEQVVPGPNVIPRRYPVYSPFLSRILDDLRTGVLWDDKFYEHFGDDWLRQRLAVYDRLLAFDPISTGMEVDDRYVVVHPHPYPDQVSLDMYQWRVMDRIAKLVAPNVDMSGSINVLQF